VRFDKGGATGVVPCVVMGKEGGTKKTLVSLRLRSCGLFAELHRPKPLSLSSGYARAAPWYTW
jgi:hypothetical protein